MFERVHTRKRAGAAHHRDKATALLVGPYRDAHRLIRHDASVVEGSQHLQAGEHAVVAVEFTARRLRIDMASGQHDTRRRIAPGPRREDVARPVDFDAAAGVAQPADHEISSLPIEVGERETAHASLGRGADFCQVHE